MHLNPLVYDLWVFRRTDAGVEFLLLHTSQQRADRHFSGGRFWQIPSGVFESEESVPAAVDRELAPYGLIPREVWAAEHAYTIYNRRFHEIQIISVYAVAVDSDIRAVHLSPAEHSEYEWVTYETALGRVHYRGLRDGIRSVSEHITCRRSSSTRASVTLTHFQDPIVFASFDGTCRLTKACCSHADSR